MLYTWGLLAFFKGSENAFRLIIRCWPWLIERVKRAMKTEQGGERNWARERERERGETLCSSSSCYFNPDSALKYGHHVDSHKKCGSSVGLANQRSPGRRDVGRVRESEPERGIKVCEQRRRVRAQEPHLQESWTIRRPMETGSTNALFFLIVLR